MIATISCRMGFVTHWLFRHIAMEPGWKWGDYGCGLHIRERHWAYRLHCWVTGPCIREIIRRSEAATAEATD